MRCRLDCTFQGLPSSLPPSLPRSRFIASNLACYNLCRLLEHGLGLCYTANLLPWQWGCSSGHSICDHKSRGRRQSSHCWATSQRRPCSRSATQTSHNTCSFAPLLGLGKSRWSGLGKAVVSDLWLLRCEHRRLTIMRCDFFCLTITAIDTHINQNREEGYTP